MRLLSKADANILELNFSYLLTIRALLMGFIIIQSYYLQILLSPIYNILLVAWDYHFQMHTNIVDQGYYL